MKEPVVIGGRVILLEPKDAQAVRVKQVELAEKSRRISRDLRQSGILPRGHGNRLAGWTGSNHTEPAPTTDNRIAWAESKKQSVETRWQKHLAKNAL